MSPVPTTGTTGVNRLVAAAFGLRLVSDLPERLARWRLPCPPDTKRRARIDLVRRSGVLFVHVPKNAGTSVSGRLYGTQVKHASVRYYAAVAPDLLDLPAFAVVRDPVERFLSAFAYARAGGTADRAISHPFRRTYAAFKGVNDAIDHLAAARSPFQVDHVFRPQSWYLHDAAGTCRVPFLVPYEMLDALGALTGLPELAVLPRTNRCSAPPPPLTQEQDAFIRTFYAGDYALRRRAITLTSPASRPCSARRAIS